jgi:hypothetical protein
MRTAIGKDIVADLVSITVMKLKAHVASITNIIAAFDKGTPFVQIDGGCTHATTRYNVMNDIFLNNCTFTHSQRIYTSSIIMHLLHAMMNVVI